ncbi:SdpI family protein [Nocardiopsis eucommiae]|uniref:SdpI family protein n=1 Tax=Nocardiopsis eucommiae TaxID=2831970 RepID=A0A975LBK1_9ACTN|nr:SdpI family protein [Nocardiopsis eucommiae]
MNPLAASSDQMMPLGAIALMMASLLLMAVALVLMGVRGARRRIRPNRLFGIRTAYTFSGDFAWYTVHELAAPWSIVAGLVCLPGLVLLPVAATPNLQVAAVLAPIGASLVVLLVGTWRAHRVARERAARDAGRADLP